MEQRYPKPTDRSNLEEKEFKNKISHGPMKFQFGFPDRHEGLMGGSWMPPQLVSTPD